MLTPAEIRSLLGLALRANHAAMQAVMEVYSTPFSVDYKDDDSPVTHADREADRIIREVLGISGFYVMSEEEPVWPYAQRSELEHLWIADPLDGTKEFVKRNGEFTTNIALIEQGIPVLGIVGAPALDKVYFAAKGIGAFTCSVQESKAADNIEKALQLPLPAAQRPFRIIGSRSHPHPATAEYMRSIMEKIPGAEIVYGGSSLKLCRIAEGSADLYPRFSPISEWDIAAGHALVKYAGGKMLDFATRKEIMYNKEILRQPPFIAASGKGLEWI